MLSSVEINMVKRVENLDEVISISLIASTHVKSMYLTLLPPAVGK